MVVMKLVVKEPSEKRKRRQLLPTPESKHNEKLNPQMIISNNIIKITYPVVEYMVNKSISKMINKT